MAIPGNPMNESNPLHPLRLLSFDGGGVRGLSSLMILQDLMENIAKEEKRLHIRPYDNNDLPLPCDYFDLIGGTSTGGIIAILLGRLRLDVRDCIAIYSKLAGQIFKKDRSIKIAGAKLPTGSTRFSGAVLEKAIKDALKTYGFDGDEKMWDHTLFEEVDFETDMARRNIWTDVMKALPAGPCVTQREITMEEVESEQSVSVRLGITILWIEGTLLINTHIVIQNVIYVGILSVLHSGHQRCVLPQAVPKK